MVYFGLVLLNNIVLSFGLLLTVFVCMVYDPCLHHSLTWYVFVRTMEEYYGCCVYTSYAAM